MPQGLFDGFIQAARADTPGWMKGFLDNFYNMDTLRGTLVSDQAWQASWNLAVTASATAAVACIGTWATGFRDDLPKIDVPVLILHGDADQVLPLDKTAGRLPGRMKDAPLSWSRAARTPSSGRTPSRSTPPYSISCAPEPAARKEKKCHASNTTQETTMSTTEAGNASRDTAVGHVGMHLEIQVIPVSGVDRSKDFYTRLGWRFDDDVAPLDGLRIVQFTPPGSAASITFGLGLTTAVPGSAEGGLTVSDIETAHDEVISRGIDASDIWHGPPFPAEARQPGPGPDPDPDPERASYGSFFSINDPDGNTWLVQEVTTRRPGR